MRGVRNVGSGEAGKKARLDPPSLKLRRTGDGREALLTAENAQNAERRFGSFFALCG
jgi:hypothetical protein